MKLRKMTWSNWSRNSVLGVCLLGSLISCSEKEQTTVLTRDRAVGIHQSNLRPELVYLVSCDGRLYSTRGMQGDEPGQVDFHGFLADSDLTHQDGRTFFDAQESNSIIIEQNPTTRLSQDKIEQYPEDFRSFLKSFKTLNQKCLAALDLPAEDEIIENRSFETRPIIAVHNSLTPFTEDQIQVSEMPHAERGDTILVNDSFKEFLPYRSRYLDESKSLWTVTKDYKAQKASDDRQSIQSDDAYLPAELASIPWEAKWHPVDKYWFLVAQTPAKDDVKIEWQDRKKMAEALNIACEEMKPKYANITEARKERDRFGKHIMIVDDYRLNVDMRNVRGFEIKKHNLWQFFDDSVEVFSYCALKDMADEEKDKQKKKSKEGDEIRVCRVEEKTGDVIGLNRDDVIEEYRRSATTYLRMGVACLMVLPNY